MGCARKSWEATQASAASALPKKSPTPAAEGTKTHSPKAPPPPLASTILDGLLRGMATKVEGLAAAMCQWIAEEARKGAVLRVDDAHSCIKLQT